MRLDNCNSDTRRMIINTALAKHEAKILEDKKKAGNQVMAKYKIIAAEMSLKDAKSTNTTTPSSVATYPPFYRQPWEYDSSLPYEYTYGLSQSQTSQPLPKINDPTKPRPQGVDPKDPLASIYAYATPPKNPSDSKAAGSTARKDPLESLYVYARPPKSSSESKDNSRQFSRSLSFGRAGLRYLFWQSGDVY
ncbi:uncharacterized protein STEHIDRAFT_109643 [Stereum hirsutum FP-91666 SS1]|uniref:uncharacterized protein n=1 Tax=Stereum hirsutum (strain FP-91666) TaxID=721885 RepID=UPI000440A00E|nr:uncharacterized protein STEHIDRAFT_109643 [Stereum hirsutum FP-91666 SS1]EIM87759.1 hypothetical protein STEHIDRAFT_109643 [Stereum hirsutum FP-91666 SS1]